MDLRKRLAQMDHLTRKQNPATPKLKSDLPDAVLTELGLVQAPDSGPPVWRRDYRDEFSQIPSALPALDGFFTRAREADPALEEILFLDTETTGLAGGTGTIAFLVGVGWFGGHGFESRQYFLPDFSHEEAMLRELRRLAEGFQVVMTFNGASFDLPLLRTRALMNRLPDPCGQLASWDLLVPGRRLWGRVLDNCRQQTLEENLVGLRRGPGDIDGALIPQTWFDFLATGDGRAMGKVLHHNQKDLLGMAHILAAVLVAARNLTAAAPVVPGWREAWSLARVSEKARLRETAAQWMVRALNGARETNSDPFGQRCFVADAVRLLKRQGRYGLVAEVVDSGLAAGLDEPWIHREAAIVWEHRLGRLDRALFHAHRCAEPGRVRRLERKIILQEGN